MIPMIAFAAEEDYVEWDGTGDFPTSGKVRLTAPASGTPRLKSDIEVDGSLTFDLNGQTLNMYSCSFVVGSGDELTIVDSSSTNAGVIAGISYSKGYIVTVDGGKATISGGTFQYAGLLNVKNGGTAEITGNTKVNASSTSQKVSSVLVEGEGSVLNMTGGTLGFNGDSSHKAAIEVKTGAVANISGGTITKSGNNNAAVKVGGTTAGKQSTVNITGGVIENRGAHYGLWIQKNGIANISGDAQIINSGDGYDFNPSRGIYIVGNGGGSAPVGVVNMSGGTVTNTGNGTAVAIDNDRADEDGTVEGGIFNLSGGTVQNTNTEGGNAVDAQGKLEMSGGNIIQANKDLAAVVNTDDSPFGALGRSIINISGGEISAVADIFDESVTGENVKEKPVVSGGVFSQNVSDYVADEDVIAVYSSGNDTGKYAVGAETVDGIAQAASSGDTITVIRGDISLASVSEGVNVSNQGEGSVSVNGVNVTNGEKVTACEHKNVTETAAKEATCADEGNIRYWYCPDCKAYFKDAELAAEITEDDTVVEATGKHNYVNGVCSVCKAEDPDYDPSADTKDPAGPETDEGGKNDNEQTVTDEGGKNDDEQTVTADKSAKTGDTSNLVLFAGLAVLAAAGAAGAGIYGRRKKHVRQ